MSWAEHAAAIEAANEALDLVAQSVSAAIIQSQRAATRVAQATGGNNCSSATGREAFEMAAGLEDQAPSRVVRVQFGPKLIADLAAPSADSVRNAEGHGVGRGATRGRSGEGAEA